MDTSRSTDWLAQALVYSGRPDPTWVVPSGAVQELLGLWADLPPGREQHPGPPPLGYRGCLLRAPDGRTWRASGGSVTLEDGLPAEVRADPDRRFERLLLATAPPGTLPPFAAA
jgi:hypothetical protein